MRWKFWFEVDDMHTGLYVPDTVRTRYCLHGFYLENLRHLDECDGKLVIIISHGLCLIVVARIRSHSFMILPADKAR